MNRRDKLRRFPNKLLQVVGLRPTLAPAWPLQDNCHIPTILNQLQSPLFGKLSIELRISIYSDVLGDLERFLHICLNKKKKGRRVAHWRCTDTESPFPTWQHNCFRDLPFLKSGTYHNFPPGFTTTNDLLTALLLSCRRIYSEALAILYERNIFHFRGGITLPAFKRSIPIVQWAAIRNVHISTAYTPWLYPLRFASYKPPKSLPNWDQICKDLGSLPNLQSLSFDILANDVYAGRGSFGLAAPRPVLPFLESLKAIKCKRMEVELNMELPGDLLHRLGPVNYKITVRERPYHGKYYRIGASK
ncbi:hypothetical protein DM02DRAFT_632443 [Periconia macrospinosa]|uniref:DUF7730 domain-containing protein n=1 Tax=Periconia macrospinosa TaxID=97972 RepID=A0A2V1DCV5_9PLEO|nr:hypothetical protein DM02DRAFT_632443 [Periconia macrospinosa]